VNRPPAQNAALVAAITRAAVSVRRFAELQQAGPALINTVPAISVFFKPRMSGVRYLKESDDRAVITWSLTEPFGGIQDWTWKPTVNRFQAVLRKDGTIDLSYDGEPWRIAGSNRLVRSQGAPVHWRLLQGHQLRFMHPGTRNAPMRVE
jgi:hypothetical protein